MRLGLGACLGLLSLSAGAAHADAPNDVVVEVGASVQRVSDVARRLTLVPGYQLATLGDRPETIRQRFVDSVLVPELLHAEEAARRGLSSAPEVVDERRRVLRRSLVDSLREGVVKSGIAEADVRAYYDAHLAEYRAPERIRIARILVADEALARRILSEVSGPEAASKFSRLAREHSVDAATKMRAGALGFVHPDGHTDVPQLAVDPALYAAAQAVRDGDLVAEPVKEGGRFAVVWRRGSLPATERTFQDESPRIREILTRQRVEQALTALIQELRARHLTALDPAPLESWEPPSKPVSRATSAAGAPGPGSSAFAPRATERGLR